MLKTFKFRFILSHLLMVIFSLGLMAYFLGESLEIRRAAAAAFALSAVFALAAASRLLSFISGPLDAVVRGSKKFAAGDFNYRINIETPEEMKKLSGTLNKMAGEIEDKFREFELRQQQLSAIFTGMAEGIIATDRAGVVLNINAATERILGVPAGAIGGKSVIEAFRNAQLQEITEEALKTGAAVFREIEPHLPVKGVFRVNAGPLFEKGRVSGCLLVIHDITELRRLETMRRDFVANVSHELKTPLTAIKGYVETLLAGGMEDKANRAEFLTIILGQAGRLENLINDLLNLSRLESGASVMEFPEVDLKALADEIYSGLRNLFAFKKLEFINELPQGLVVSADKDKMVQALTNLLDNAAKFNVEKGFVRLTSSALEGGLRITVEDSGIGIPERHLPRIFERFYRVDKARSRELGGTGLGLSIVKHLVELHGGSVGVESLEGSGSKFWFTLPKHFTHILHRLD